MSEVIRDILIVLAGIIAAPLLGGLLSGTDRVITARLQGRKGPPVLQPFYDVLKLFGKESITVNQTQIVFVIANLFFAVTALVLFLLGEDLLMILFILTFSHIALIIGAMSIRSPYSKIGASREIMQMLSYEPVLVLMIVGVFLTTDSFMVKDAFVHESPLLYNLPLVFAALLYVLTIMLRKSPFDFSTSHHGHQELIKGLTIEFSGTQLAFIEITHWYELVLVLGLIVMFFARPIWVGIIIAGFAFFLEMIIDNISARMTWKWMLKATWLVGIGAAVTNITWLYLR